jgi:uncharacterized protein
LCDNILIDELRVNVIDIEMVDSYLNGQVPAIIPTGLTQPVDVSLPAAVKRIVTTLNPEKIILFGSFAHGNPTPDSDIDLLVIMHTSESSKERSWAVSQLLLPRPFPVDILVRTPEEIESALENKDFFIQGILKHGIVLYEG